MLKWAQLLWLLFNNKDSGLFLICTTKLRMFCLCKLASVPWHLPINPPILVYSFSSPLKPAIFRLIFYPVNRDEKDVQPIAGTAYMLDNIEMSWKLYILYYYIGTEASWNEVYTTQGFATSPHGFCQITNRLLDIQ